MYKYSFYDPEFEKIADNIKISVVKALVKEKLMDYKNTDEWCENHTIIFKKKSIFRTLSDKWSKSETEHNSSYMLVVKKIV